MDGLAMTREVAASAACGGFLAMTRGIAAPPEVAASAACGGFLAMTRGIAAPQLTGLAKTVGFVFARS